MEIIAQIPTFFFAFVESVFGEHPSWDVLLYVGLLGGASVAGLWGRARLVAALVATYITACLLGVPGSYDWIAGTVRVPSTVWGIAGIVIGVSAILFVFVQYGLGGVLEEEEGTVTTSVVLALSILGFLTAAIFSKLDPDTIQGFSALTQTLFASHGGFVAWILAPLALVAATRD